jgi:ATP-binding cassette subfamily B protein
MRRLLGYVLRHRTALLWGVFCSAVSVTAAVGAPIVLRRAIDDLAVAVTRPKLLRYGSALFAVGAVSAAFRFWSRRAVIGAARHIEYEMRNDFFAALQTLPATYFHAHRTGDLMSRATNDLNAVRTMAGHGVIYATNTALTLVTAIVMMLSIDVALTAASLIPLGLMVVLVVYCGRAIRQGFERTQAQLSELSSVAQEAFSGVRAVRTYRRESADMERFLRANHEYMRHSRRVIAIQALFLASITLLIGAGSVAALWTGGRKVIRHDITIGDLVAFFSSLAMLSWPVLAFGWITNMLQRGMASWKRMLEVLDAAQRRHDEGQRYTRAGLPAAAVQAGAAPLDAVRGAIDLRHLTFAYGRAQVLRDVSARIPAGQTTAIVGATGSGKSTLINVITRVFEPGRGTVFVDGVDVRDWPIDTLRRACAVVPQDPFLFAETIEDNVAFGLDAVEARVRRSDGATASKARRRQVERAAAIARLDTEIAGFPNAYATVVGERGTTLSGGQRQRVAIARALLMRPRVLILDDAFSAVDACTEEEILRRVRRAMRGRTLIIVSHRVATVRDADQILVLDEGQIVDGGTHEALISRSGLYAELHRRQLVERELATS